MEVLKASFAPGVRGLIAPLHAFLNDNTVTEILINRPHEVFIEKEGVMQRFEMPILTHLYLRRLFLMIANENNQILSEDLPILSGNLYDGSRVQLLIPPAAKFETLSIRKFKLQILNFEDYTSQKFFNETNDVEGNEEPLKTLYQQKHWPLFLKKAIELKKNIIISGSTSSGKTTFLNSCMNLIPEHERLITIEDTYEINTNRLNIVSLKSVKTLSNTAPAISMQDLIQASLRLRPDRIIMGEIRGREIFDFVNAATTGHPGILATIHAPNPKIAFMRMAQLYKLNNIPGMSEADIYKELHEVINVIVQLKKTSEGRRLTQVYFKDVD